MVSDDRIEWYGLRLHGLLPIVHQVVFVMGDISHDNRYRRTLQAGNALTDVIKRGSGKFIEMILAARLGVSDCYYIISISRFPGKLKVEFEI